MAHQNHESYYVPPTLGGQGEGDKQVVGTLDVGKEVSHAHEPERISPYHDQYLHPAPSLSTQACPGCGHDRQSTPTQWTAHSPAPQPQSQDADPPRPRSRQRSILYFVVAALVAIVAGVAGGLAGWKVTEARQQSASCDGGGGVVSGEKSGGGCPAAPTNDTSANVTTGARATIRPASALAVAGYWVEDSYSIRIFYQAPDQRLMFSTFTSIYGLWTLPRAAKLGPNQQMMIGGPLAATVLYWMTGDIYSPSTTQVQLYYLSPEGRLAGCNFRDSYPGGISDSINDKSFFAGKSAKLSALWPYVQYVDAKGVLSEVFGSASSRSFPNLTSSAVAADSPLLSLPGTVSRGKGENEVRLYFRGTDGQLTLHTRSADGGAVASLSGPLGVTIPASAPLAGFTFVRPSGGSLDTLLLFQSPADGQIVVLSQTDGSVGTKFSSLASDPVFAGADVPTNIACLTQGTGVDASGQVSQALSARSDLNLCFFQADGGKLRVVHYDGATAKWSNRGYVPMP